MKTINLKIYKLLIFPVICYLLFVVAMPAEVLSATIKTASGSGLVSYWSFDDGAGTKINDMSGNKNTGTIISTPTWVGGKFNKALSFDGSTNYIQAGIVPSVTKSGTYTFSAWLKSSTVGTQTIFQSSPSCADRNGASLSGTTLLFGYYNGTAWVGASGTVPANQYFHVVGINNGGTLSLYINGILQAGTGAPYVHCLDGNFYLGENTLIGDTSKFAGIMDDVRVYNRVLTVSEIKTLYQFGLAQAKVVHNGGLVGYWTFDDGVGSKANDMSGSKNTGILSNTSWVGGKFNKALSFNGSSSYVDAGSGINTSSVTAMTISVWVYNNAAAANKAIAGWWNGTNGIFIQNETTATDGVIFVAGGGSSFGTVNYTTVNRWTHVVLVYDGSLTGDSNRLKGYVDGVQRTLTFNGGVIPASITTSGNFMIGNINTLTRYWNGKIDEAKVYNRALSATEIQQMYKQNAAQVNSSKNDFLTNGLVGLWSFDGKDMNWGSNKVFDRSGQGNDGTLLGMSTSSSPVNGKIGQALKFRGVSSGSYVNLGTSATLTPANFTVSAWVNAGSGTYTSGYGYIYSNARDCCTAGQNGINVFFTSGILYAVIWNGGSAASVNSPVAVAQNSGWHHIVATYNGATLVVYVDGVLKNSANTALGVGTPATFTTNIGSMGYAPGVYTFDGKIDDVRLYNRAISATEVKQLYNMAR